MILQKLSMALRRQDWFTVVLEILIVVIGIFLGLQANEWNESRVERQLERTYLERIHADLLADVEQREDSTRLANRRMWQASFLLDGIDDKDVASRRPVEFAEAIEKVSWRTGRMSSHNAYDELSGTGRTTLIRSIPLRNQIAEYYATVEFWRGILDRSSLSREYSVASAGILSMSHLAAIEASGPTPARPDFQIDSNEGVALAEQLEARIDAVRLIPMLHKNHSTVTVANAEVRALNDELRSAIESYLGSRSVPERKE